MKTTNAYPQKNLAKRILAMACVAAVLGLGLPRKPRPWEVFWRHTEPSHAPAGLEAPQA